MFKVSNSVLHLSKIGKSMVFNYSFNITDSAPVDFHALAYALLKTSPLVTVTAGEFCFGAELKRNPYDLNPVPEHREIPENFEEFLSIIQDAFPYAELGKIGIYGHSSPEKTNSFCCSYFFKEDLPEYGNLLIGILNNVYGIYSALRRDIKAPEYEIVQTRRCRFVKWEDNGVHYLGTVAPEYLVRAAFGIYTFSQENCSKVLGGITIDGKEYRITNKLIDIVNPYSQYCSLEVINVHSRHNSKTHLELSLSNEAEDNLEFSFGKGDDRFSELVKAMDI